MERHRQPEDSAIARQPRYRVGIDLGTTHTLVAFAPATGGEVEIFPLEQLVAPGEVAPRPLLASMRYHPAPGELADGDMALPWPLPDFEAGLPKAVQGALARELGGRVPGRLVASAKSWLSHAAVDRTAPILPWGAPAEVAKVSPLAASAGYLAYVRSAWNQAHPHDPLEAQDLVLTLPASFDESARALTVEAARLAGLARVRLLEEPQAACYDWLTRHHDDLTAALGTARLLLVVDVGGGTTDLTLIKVEPGQDGPRLTRIGVGDHLMLGGDNMDLALAHLAEQRLGGGRLGAGELSQLLQQCRSAKERLLAPDAPASATVTLLGAGSKLIGGARSVTFDRDEVRSLVVDGFLPRVEFDARPQGRRGGIVEFGLPFVADPAISRHVAAFLARHAAAAAAALGDDWNPDGELPPLPDALLLNGGVFNAGVLVERLVEILTHWRGGAAPRLLHNVDPDLAVARGAVAYARARAGQGVRIAGGSARSYVLLLEGDEGQGRQGVCLLPRGSEEGVDVLLPERTFALRLGQPVAFHLASSTGDEPLTPGQLLAVDYEQFMALPPMATVLGREGGGEVRVQLIAQLTEVGTLALACVAEDDPTRRWALEFQLRGSAGEAAAPGARPHPRIFEAYERIERAFGARIKGVSPKEVKQLRADLEKILGKREGWETPLLRELYGMLWEGVKRRRRSADHERVWLSLVGFCLRPGFGAPLDDWRLEQLWSLYDQGVQYGNDGQVLSEWWTLWRRVAGGLSAPAQETILADLSPHLPPQPRKGKAPKAVDDMIRLAAVLERLPVERKIDVGRQLLERLEHKGESPHTWWAVGRLGVRVPLYGSAHNVVPRQEVAGWLEALLREDWRQVQQVPFAAALLARLSGDRERDLEPALRQQVIDRLKIVRAPDSWQRMVGQVVELDEADQQRIYGESLPPGLRLIH